MLGLVCLAVSDLVVGVLIQPLFIAIFVNMLRGHLDCGLLKAMNFIYTLSNGLRLVSLFAVNGDRFLIIQFPYWYGASITNRVFIVSWCFAVLAFDSVGVLMQTQLDHTNHITYTVASAFGLRVIMWGCSIAVYITARKHQKRLAVAPGPADAEGIEDRKARLRNAKHGKVICFVTLFHFVIFSSAAILISIAIGKMDPPCPGFKAISSALANALVNTESMINPLVYGFCLKRIRRAVRKLFCGGHRPNDSSIRI
ncbi:predicted protein [Nematostella vectensis]|uniref:G-protein coupled receptors family 1 profile domain-containing protein n=1 Tax=Nematostella vectensis TaxID=45351 RepID=A7S568_NEMVE|nr:predicted protein [Nematostella vectensis]EDO41151.1 predicted protein [Nematostella vectensis]|eukprot:XP_001622185.1 hypothetical protein NEMVEDRAFT_v1g221062 [Nematostella vectensis]